MVLQGFDQFGGARVGRAQNAIGLDDHAALHIGLADHAALSHGRVLEQRIFDLGATHVVSRGDDHVIVARLVMEIAIVVLHERIAGKVPTRLHIALLPRVIQVSATRGTDDRQAPDLVAR